MFQKYRSGKCDISKIITLSVLWIPRKYFLVQNVIAVNKNRSWNYFSLTRIFWSAPKGKKLLYLSHFTFSVNIFADSHARDSLKYVWMQNTFGVKLPELLYSLQKNRIRKQKNMYMYFVPKETLNVRFGAYEKWQAALVKNN